jgi:hypothetical protein
MVNGASRIVSDRFEIHQAALSACSKVNVLLGVISKKANVTLVAVSKKLPSKQCQQFLALNLATSEDCVALFTPNHNIGNLSKLTSCDIIAATSERFLSTLRQ